MVAMAPESYFKYSKQVVYLLKPGSTKPFMDFLKGYGETIFMLEMFISTLPVPHYQIGQVILLGEDQVIKSIECLA